MSCIVDAFNAVVRDAPDAPLILLPDGRDPLTAAALSTLYQRQAEHLRGAGLHPGDLLVSSLGNRPAFVGLVLACRVLDIAMLAIDTAAAKAEREQIAERFGARAVVTPANSDDVAHGLSIELRAGAVTSYPGAAMLKLTSGSTSIPKATFTTEMQLVTDTTQIIATQRIAPSDVQLVSIPLSHAYGFSVVLVPTLMQGTPMVMRESFAPHQLAADVERFGITRFPGAPFMFDHLLRQAPLKAWPARLGRVVSAGAPLAPALARAFHDRFGVKVHVFYGTTETGGITYDESDDPDNVETVGRPLRGVTVSFREQPAITGGRIHVRSGAVSSGYVGSDVGDFIDDGFLTGDYGALNGNGQLILAGRVSAFINVAGRKVPPTEVEDVLARLEGVADVRVLAGIDDPRGEHVLACVVRDPGSKPLTSFDVRQFCARNLAPHKTPRTIVFVDAIPLTARGKTDVDALHALIRATGQRTRK